MKTTKEDIMMVALHLFGERGFDAVSTSMIAGQLGITKGALYNHFKDKQEIMDSIIQRMFELDAQRANEDNVPVGDYSEDAACYKQTQLIDFCEFVNNQFIFWTEDSFASAFRRMLTLEQYKSEEMSQLYQNVIGMGPVAYSEDLFREMIASGQMNEAAKKMGPQNLAIQFFAPLHLMIQLADGGADVKSLKEQLREITKDFQERWT